MKAYFYQLEAISNLHVGSGEANEGVVDLLIQRDSVTGLPVVNSSSLKGAFREFFSEQCPAEELCHIFGNAINEVPGARNKREHNAGKYRFFEARILGLPVRCDKLPYVMVTCPSIIHDFNNTLNLLDSNRKMEIPNWELDDSSAFVSNQNLQGLTMEELRLKAKSGLNGGDFITRLLGENWAMVSDCNFKLLCDDRHLPILARNQLLFGKSQNLWYEQVLPRFTRMYFSVMVPNENDQYFNKFDSMLTSGLVQVGANATVGYGYCKVANISSSNK